MSSEEGGAKGTATDASIVRDTAENVLHQLNSDLEKGGEGAEVNESQLLQSSEPGPLGEDARDVEEVLNVISQSIYREAEG